MKKKIHGPKVLKLSPNEQYITNCHEHHVTIQKTFWESIFLKNSISNNLLVFSQQKRISTKHCFVSFEGEYFVKPWQVHCLHKRSTENLFLKISEYCPIDFKKILILLSCMFFVENFTKCWNYSQIFWRFNYTKWCRRKLTFRMCSVKLQKTYMKTTAMESLCRPRSASLLNNELYVRCFLVNFGKFVGTPIL